MALIALEGMHFHAYHGVYEPEQIIGQEYIVDVYVNTDITAAAMTDQLAATVNYETIFQICRLQMEEPRRLIESVTAGIIAQLKHQFSTIHSVKVRVRKMNPPLGGRVDSSYIEEDEEYLEGCPRCGKPHICYGDDTCWCKKVDIHIATRETVQRQFKKCLCPACMKFFAG